MALRAEQPAPSQTNPKTRGGGEDVVAWLEEQKKRQYDSQVAFAALPSFRAESLLNASGEKLMEYNQLVSREKIKPGTRTNISQIETIYPWLLQQEGIIENLIENTFTHNEEYAKAALYGTKLHKADVLFSIIMQREGGRPGLPLQHIVPTERDAREMQAYERVTTGGMGRGKIRDQDDLETRLLLAWTNYHLLTEPEEIYHEAGGEKSFAVPLPGFGLPDPQARRALYSGDELGEIGARLARATAREYFKEEPLTWEFRHDSLSQRELMVSLNFRGPKLSFNIRVDAISRLWHSRRKYVEAQTIDLKTGKKREFEGIEAEIRKRQKQVTLIASERFVSKYMLGKKGKHIQSLVPPAKGSFFTSVHNDKRLLARRLNLAGYRWFNQGTSEFELEALSMSAAERQEFFDWMAWYGSLVNYYKPEIKKLVKRKPSWNLRAVASASGDFFIPDQQPAGFV